MRPIGLVLVVMAGVLSGAVSNVIFLSEEPGSNPSTQALVALTGHSEEEVATLAPGLIISGIGERIDAAPQAEASASNLATSSEDASAEVQRMRAELARLQQRNAWLEEELLICGTGITQGPVGRWLSLLQDFERPPAEVLRSMHRYLAPFPVELTVAEGLWLRERIEQEDWKAWGATIDEALISFLGVERLRRELEPEKWLVLLRDMPELVR